MKDFAIVFVVSFLLYLVAFFIIPKKYNWFKTWGWKPFFTLCFYSLIMAICLQIARKLLE